MKGSNELPFFSFLKQLKQHSRKIYVLALIAIITQLFFTVIKLEAIPFFLYGMFSEKIAATDTFSTVKIVINDKPLEYYSSSYREKALLETNFENYEAFKLNNHTDPLKTRIESRYAIISHSVAYPMFANRIYNNVESEQKFKKWFRQKCLDIAETSTGTINVVRTHYYLNRDSLHFNKISDEILESF